MRNVTIPFSPSPQIHRPRVLEPGQRKCALSKCQAAALEDTSYCGTHSSLSSIQRKSSVKSPGLNGNTQTFLSQGVELKIHDFIPIFESKSVQTEENKN